jgi:hydrogenase maturation protease
MSSGRESGRRVVIGVGNAWQADDGAGLVVAERLRELLPDDVEVVRLEGEPVTLVQAWEGADEAYVVDAVSSGAEPGTVHRVDATRSPLPRELSTASTHLFGVGESVELARSLGRLPRRLIVYGIEAARISAGSDLSPEVRAAVDETTTRLLEELEGG